MEKIKIGFISAIIIPIFVLVYFIAYTFIEPMSYDFMMRNVVTKRLPFDKNKNIDGHNDIVIIMVDDKTLEKYRWPWKREKWCKIFNYLNEYSKPKVIAHDSLVTSLDIENPESDKIFFDTIAKSDIIMQGFSPSYIDLDDPKEGRKYDASFIRKSYITASYNARELPSIYQSMIKMPEPNMNALKHAGSTRMTTSFITGNLRPYARGNKFRTYEYFINYRGFILPSFALEAFMISKGDPTMVITKKYMGFPELNYKIKHRITPFQAVVPLKFYNTKPYTGYSHQKYSAADIMSSYDELQNGEEPLIDPIEFKDKIVLIGANAEGARDEWPTPMLTFHPGPDIHATAIDNIIHNDFLKVVSDYINYLVVLFGIFIMYKISEHKRLIDLFSAVFVLSALYLLLTCIFYYFGIIINIITPIIVWIVSIIPILIYKIYKIEVKLCISKNN